MGEVCRAGDVVAAEDNLCTGDPTRADLGRPRDLGFAVGKSPMDPFTIGTDLCPFYPVDAAYGAAIHGWDLVFSFDLCGRRRSRHDENDLKALKHPVQIGVKLLLTGLTCSLKL